VTHQAEKKLRALIVEDEQSASSLLDGWLRESDYIGTVDVATSLAQAKLSLNELNPEIIFLDIELPDGIGFDLFDNHSTEKSPYIIFTTAYDEYAVKAFRVNAVDYLLKPFSKAQLHDAIERAITRSRPYHKALDNQQGHFSNLLPIKHRGQTIFLQPSEIIYLKSEDYYTAVYTNDRCYLSRIALKALNKNLADYGFVQVHRSFVINLAMLTASKSISGGDYELTLSNGQVLRMSRRYKQNFEAAMHNHYIASPVEQ